ncbi:alpha-L-fucosidase [candidate division KSB1 bacterium]|nr:alpha-L-fucosidase [candidate division KSB1 bacterium]MBL7094806.1 alpha-L-fucosidase [candidate division KSB1 bacterium]
MKCFYQIILVITLLLLLAIPSCTQTDYLNESQPDRDARMKWWRDARFGMFIHWGLYAVPAGEYKGERVKGIGEWIQASLNIPCDEYEQFAKQFNPVKYDPAEWVSLAKQAGMKYLVITSKHHDGFSLWDSDVSDYDVVDSTPYGKDLLVPLSQECKKQGIKFCVYHSILDWHHPSQYVDPEADNPLRGHSRNKIHADKKADYVKYMKTQLKELVNKVDPAVLWFDGEWVEWWTEEDGKNLYNYLRSMKPEMIINNRVGKGRKGMEGLSKGAEYAGDFGTPEQQIPAKGLPGVDWESCMTMNDTWGYKYFDDNWKSTETLIQNIIDIASKGGNYLLNIGPTAEGLIPEESVIHLKEIGNWMDAFGETIYESSASPFEKPDWGRFIQKDDKIHAYVFDWPENRKLAVPLAADKIKRALIIGKFDAELLKVESIVEGSIIHLPEFKSIEIVPVIVIEQK